MKKGRFLWSAHRITKKQKAGKARNIKEKQLKNSRNTVSKLRDVLPSSRSAEFSSYKHPHFVGACFLPLHIPFPAGSPAGRAILLGIGRFLSGSWRNFREKPGTLLCVECRVFFRRGQLAKQESGLREDSGDFSVCLGYTGYRKFTAAQEGFP
jgi:hypothetical protein